MNYDAQMRRFDNKPLQILENTEIQDMQFDIFYKDTGKPS